MRILRKILLVTSAIYTFYICMLSVAFVGMFTSLAISGENFHRQLLAFAIVVSIVLPILSGWRIFFWLIRDGALRGTRIFSGWWYVSSVSAFTCSASALIYYLDYEIHPLMFVYVLGGLMVVPFLLLLLEYKLQVMEFVRLQGGAK